MKKIIAQNPIVFFILLAYGFSWACWLPILNNITTNPFEAGAPTLLVLMLGAWGPTISALLLTRLIHGKGAIKKELKKYLMWRAAFRWYLVAFFAVPFIRAISTGIFLLQGGEIDYVNYMVIALYPVFLGVSIVFGPLAEEMGWRGFALPRLYERYGFALSAIFVGIIATFWHTPLFWAAAGTTISGSEVSLLSVGQYLIYVIGTSFLYTLVFKNTNGSVLFALFVHLSINGSGTAMGYMLPNLKPEEIHTLWLIEIAVTWVLIVAAGLLYRSRLSTKSKTA